MRIFTGWNLILLLIATVMVLINIFQLRDLLSERMVDKLLNLLVTDPLELYKHTSYYKKYRR